MTSTVEIRLWEVTKTEKAVAFSKLPKDRNPDIELIWVPRSMIEHISRAPGTDPEWRECTVKLQEWYAQKKGLL